MFSRYEIAVLAAYVRRALPFSRNYNEVKAARILERYRTLIEEAM